MTANSNKMPVFSILIPTYNREKFIPLAVESCLKQDYPHIEIIISDNCSKDNTQKISEELCKKSSKIKYFRNDRNYGMVGNWQKCLYEYCTGDYGILLSDDDLLCDPSFLSQAVTAFQKNPEVGIVFSGIKISQINEQMKILNEEEILFPELSGAIEGKEVFFKYFRRKSTVSGYTIYVYLSSTCFDITIAKKLGCFTQEIISEDFRSWFLFMGCSNFYYLNVVGSQYTIHANQFCSNLKGKNSWEVYLKNFDSLLDPEKYLIQTAGWDRKRTENQINWYISECFKGAWLGNIVCSWEVFSFFNFLKKYNFRLYSIFLRTTFISPKDLIRLILSFFPRVLQAIRNLKLKMNTRRKK